MASFLLKKHKKIGNYTLSDLQTLGRQLLSSRYYVNNLPILLTFLTPSSPPQHALESLLSLHSFFTPLLPQIPPSSSKRSSSSADDPEFIYRAWLRSKFDDFVRSLIDFSISPQSEEALTEVVADTLMECVKLGNGGKFHSVIYHRFIHSIVHSTLPLDNLVDLLVSKYFKYIDVCYHTYITLEKLTRTFEVKDTSGESKLGADTDNESQSASRGLLIRKIYRMLSNIQQPDEKSEYEMLNGSGFFTKQNKNEESTKLPNIKERLENSTSRSNVSSLATVMKRMKRRFSKVWISFLVLPLPVDVFKEVLVTLHQDVIPHLTNPIMLCDFLTRSYDIGGIISVMALSSLFILMTRHGLEYPNFYEKLYALLEPSIFMAKYRAKFFELLDSCLKSPLLPAYLAAAFAKKLSRLSLSVPPSGGLIIIALIHNLLRRHPSINCLVHREDSDESAPDVSTGENCMKLSSNKSGVDHFDEEETDLVKTNAMRSSLWEMDNLRHHYCPPVSRFVLSLENDLTVRAKTAEVAVKDFSSGSYATIFRDEMRRRVKQVPLAYYKATPSNMFLVSDFPGWTFKSGANEAVDVGIAKSSQKNSPNSAKRQRTEC